MTLSASLTLSGLMWATPTAGRSSKTSTVCCGLGIAAQSDQHDVRLNAIEVG